MNKPCVFPFKAVSLLREKKYREASDILMQHYNEYGDMYACHVVATLHLENKIKPTFRSLIRRHKHIDTATLMLNRCANANLVQSQRLLGDIHSNPHYGKYSPEMAHYWYARAATNGDLKAAKEAFALRATEHNEIVLANLYRKEIDECRDKASHKT